jgi:Flp pilus assembly protein TadG
MSQTAHCARRLWARFLRDERGATLVELALLVPLFLLIFFALIDFGRMGAEYVLASKATQMAARVAAVRPAACAGVPTFNQRGAVAPGSVPPKFGTHCAAGASICANPGTITCAGSAADPTVAEIWAAIGPILPNGAAPANLSFRYAYDPGLNFLGGPYVPVVTVELQNLSFQFVTPIGGLAALAGANSNQLPASTLPFPAMSMSLPGEDLALGENG